MFNNFIKAHRYPIVPLSHNVVKTRKTTKSIGLRSSRQIDNDDAKNWHPEGELFGGMRKTRKRKRTKRRKY